MAQMNILDFTLYEFQVFFLILIRMSGLIFFAPVFGSRNIPAMAKISICLFLAYIVFPLVSAAHPNIPKDVYVYFFGVIREFIVGFFIGITALLVFIGIQLAGHFIDIQIGYGIVNIIEPQSGAQVSIIGQVYYLFALLLFLVLNGHHILLQSIVESFNIIPLAQLKVSGDLIQYFNFLVGNLFLLAVKLSAPIIGVLFLTEIAMAFVARTVPQINVFLVGFPVRIGLGLIFLSFTFPTLMYLSKNLFIDMEKNIMIVLKLLNG